MTQEEITQFAVYAGFPFAIGRNDKETLVADFDINHALTEFAKLVEEKERESCAQLTLTNAPFMPSLAFAIRARSLP